jgi:hypothetical protein
LLSDDVVSAGRILLAVLIEAVCIIEYKHVYINTEALKQ